MSSKRGGGTAPSPAGIARDVLKALRARADPVRAEGGQRYFKDTVRMFGLRGPEVRGIARDVAARVKPAWSCEDAVALCDLLYAEPQLEAKAVGTLVLMSFRKRFSESLFETIRAWLEADLLANWASVDVLVPDAMTALLTAYPGLERKIRRWPAHPNRWVKRASAVAFIKLARRGACLDAAYANAAALLPVEDDLVQKANGWLLREAGKTDGARLKRFLLERGPALPRTTLRYAIEKFSEAERRRLMAATKR